MSLVDSFIGPDTTRGKHMCTFKLLFAEVFDFYVELLRFMRNFTAYLRNSQKHPLTQQGKGGNQSLISPATSRQFAVVYHYYPFSFPR